VKNIMSGRTLRLHAQLRTWRAFSFVLFAAVQLAACGLVTPEAGDKLNFACSNDDSDPAKSVSFKDDLRPIMNRLKTDPTGPGCKSCHYEDGDDSIANPGIELGGLNMTTLGGLRKGGNTSRGVAAVPGKPCDSAIIKKIRGIYRTGVRMPKVGVRYLNEQEIQLFSDWIAEGAKGEDSE
jgi:hypothetical protein